MFKRLQRKCKYASIWNRLVNIFVLTYIKDMLDYMNVYV